MVCTGRHVLPHRARRARHVGQARRMERQRELGLAQRLVDGIERPVVIGRAAIGVGARKRGNHPHRLHPVDLAYGGFVVLER